MKFVQQLRYSSTFSKATYFYDVWNIEDGMKVNLRASELWILHAAQTFFSWQVGTRLKGLLAIRPITFMYCA